MANHLVIHFIALGLVCCFLTAAIVSETIGENLSFSKNLTKGNCYLTIAKRCFCGILSLALTALAMVSFFLTTQPVSKLHTLRTALGHVMIHIMFIVIGKPNLKKLEDATINPREAQEELLLEILSHNKNTEYGKMVKFSEVNNREDYKRIVPLSTYESYRKLIERIYEKGEQNLTVADTVDRLNLSSGTTGKPKHLPSTDMTFKVLMK